MPEARSRLPTGLDALRSILAGWPGPREEAYRQASLPADLARARFIVALTTPGILLANLADLWVAQFGPEAVQRLWFFGWQGTLTVLVLFVLRRVTTPGGMDGAMLVWLSSYVAVVLVFRVQHTPVVNAATVTLLALGCYTLLPHRLLYRVVPAIILTVGDLWVLAVLRETAGPDLVGTALAYLFLHVTGGWVAVSIELVRRHQHTAQLGEAAARRELEHLANTDALTGVRSRRRWLDQAEAERDRFQRHGQVFAILMVDLDHFKQVNDRHGHQAGDVVLQSFARLLQSEQRRLDVVGRLGGEEFAVLLPETDLAGAVEVAERLVGACREMTVDTTAGPVRITCSIGVAVAHGQETIADLLHRSDLAMLEAKRRGRDRVEVAAPAGASR